MLKDLQNEKDERNIFISNIGICDYKLPISVEINGEVYNSICTIASNVALDETSRGAHLSRIISALNESLYNKTISIHDFEKIINIIKEKSNTCGCTLDVAFEIILKRTTPVSNQDSFITIKIETNNQILYEKKEKSISISMMGTMLCPCSKEISKYGAHNQKCKAKLTLYGNYEVVNLEKVIEIIESSFSSNVYSTVKREDEKYLTEKAYENPKFSEDLIRDLLIGMRDIYDDRIVAELINYESIHEHNVYARGEMKKRPNRS